MSTRFDAIVIGTGQAGPSLARRLAQSGMKVAVIERGKFGGTCVNTGCIPTKAMVASARAAHVARRAADFGVDIAGSVTVDMRRVKARKDAISGASNHGVESSLRETANCTVYRAHARFESAREILAGNERLTADRIFINVGGRAVVPDIPGLHEVPYLTNSSMMDVDFLPRHLVILGGSYIGLEFGQMFRRFGSDVTIIEAGPRLMSREDEDIANGIREVFEAEGIHLLVDTRCTGVAKIAEGLRLAVESRGATNEVFASHLLLATGRRPNTDDLGLEAAGIASDKRGFVVVDDQLRTNVPGIWALGDCNGKGAFTHTSYNDYEIAAANLLDNDPRRVSDRIEAYALYTDPPLGRAGMTELQVRRSGRPALIATRPMTHVSRAVEKGETQGFMKVLVDAESKAILGAAILGVEGDEAIHCLLDVMYARKPYTTIQRAVHIHPTVSELIPTLFGDLKPLTSGTIPSHSTGS
jgi:pyruvate/2-oxoglutarate dehydrogenase complex dihydrolipoamide dehydrogenase (E3) component